MSAITTAFTTAEEAPTAGRQLVREARAALSGLPTLAILCATTHYDTVALVASVRRELGPVPLWGCSSSTGVFHSEGWQAGMPGRGAAVLMLIADRPGGVAWRPAGEDPGGAAAQAARAALAQAGGQASAVLLTAFPGPEEVMLQGVAEAAPGMAVVGGSASDHHAEGRFQQFCDGQVHAGGVAVAAVGGRVGTAFVHGYRPMGCKASVTRAQGRRLLTLDGRPALEIYSQWVQRPAADLLGPRLLTFSVGHALLLHRGQGTLAVHPVCAHPDGTIDTGVALREGDGLELGMATPDDLLEGVARVVAEATQGMRHPRGVLLAHCGGRALALGSRIREVAAQVQKVLPGVPWVGFLAFGEQGCAGGAAAAHANLSLAALGWGEPD